MIVTRKRANSTILLYLLLCIILNYLLLNYLFSPHSIAIPLVISEPFTIPLSPIDTPSQPYHMINQTQLSVEIQNVPVMSQLPLLPTGCEAAAAAMFLQWAGADVTMAEIADRLPKGQLPSDHGGKVIGGNPRYEFVGNPFSTSGLGVYNQPISDIIDYYLSNQSLNMTGCNFKDLLTILDSKRPLIVWATINMKEPSINSVWYDEQGEEVIWKIPEHAMVLVGYTETSIIVNDPLKGKKATYDKATFKKCWEAMGSQAITIKNPL